MISSVVNVHICFTIILAKRQSSVNAVYLKKDIVGSSLILWVCDNGCIWTYYLLSLLNLRKGSYSIISGNNPRLLIARCKMNPTHSWGSYSMMYRNDSGNINLSLKITPTHHVLRPDRKGMCANLALGVILWYFEMISGCLSDSNTTRYTVSTIVSVCISHAILWTKTGNPLIMKCEISSSVDHMWKNISLRVTKGIYIMIWWNFSKSAQLTLHNDSHTLIVVGFIICNMTYLCWLQKGIYIKIWLDHIESSYLIS